jgi:hypothetical protein
MWHKIFKERIKVQSLTVKLRPEANNTNSEQKATRDGHKSN